MNEPYHSYTDTPGQVITEHWVEVAEKCSRTYAVKGAKSMKEAIEFIHEHGTYGELDLEDGRTLKVMELDGWSQWHHTFKPQAVETIKARTCIFSGRTFQGPKQENTFAYRNWHYCGTTFVSINHPTGICDECTECLENGWTLKPKEVEA